MQEVSFENDDAAVTVLHFLDKKSNAVFTRITVQAKTDTRFQI